MNEQDTVTPNILETALKAAATPRIDNIVLEKLNEGLIPVVMTPDGYTAKLFPELEKHLPAPLRIHEKVALHDVASFIDYVNTNKADETSLWCDADYQNGKVNLYAIINGNRGSLSGWRDHVATYSPVKSVEWQRWISKNNERFSQTSFAIFIEDNLKDVATVDGMPTGTQILDMAMNLEANQDSRFKSSIRLQSGGVELSFVEKEDDTTLQKMKLFERFSLGIAPFFNGSHYRLDARLRYRVKEGVLTFWYELIRPDKVLDDAVKAEIAIIQEKTALNVLFGAPNL